MDDHADFLRLARMVYIAARAGRVDCTEAFDLATAKLDVSPLDADARELAQLSVECEQVSQSRMAEVALGLLAKTGFQPGFTEEPEWLASLEEAMRLVNQDVAATRIGRPCRLRVNDDEPCFSGTAYVVAWDGYTGDTAGLDPRSGSDPVWALIAVADDAQSALMSALGGVWPTCPVHELGVHARDHEAGAAWWCAGAGGHVVAAIGEWPVR
jgi:hypothetical protein